MDEVTAREAWDALRRDARARLVDVRTQAEWAFVGVPDLAETGRAPVLAEWQTYPSMRVDPAFVDRLREAGLGADDTLYFICRSGGRSAAAAHAAEAAVFARCVNVIDGFEGPPDADGHRGTIAGWKASGLPWTQR